MQSKGGKQSEGMSEVRIHSEKGKFQEFKQGWWGGEGFVAKEPPQERFWELICHDSLSEVFTPAHLTTSNFILRCTRGNRQL